MAEFVTQVLKPRTGPKDGRISAALALREQGRSDRNHSMGPKTQEGVEWIDAITVDYDGGASLSDVLARLIGSGLAFGLYTTHSYSKKGSFRVVLPLASPLIPLGSDGEQRAASYKATYHAVCGNLGLVNYDNKLAEIHMAVYPNRHEEAALWTSFFVHGEPLTVVAEAPPESGHGLGHAARPRGARNQGWAGVKSRHRAEVGRILEAHAEKIDLVGFFDDLGWEITDASDGTHAEIVCPNADSHSEQEEEKRVCDVFNPGVKGRRAFVKCFHQHCEELRATDLICMAIDALVLPVDFDPMAALKLRAGMDAAPMNEHDWLPASFEIDGPKIITAGEKPRVVCDVFKPLGLARDDQGLKWSLLMEFSDPDGQARHYLVDRARLHTRQSEVFAELEVLGFKINPHQRPTFLGLLHDIETGGRITLVKQPGFVGRPAHSFVPPLGEVIQVGEGLDPVYYPHATAAQRSGTLEGQSAAYEIACQIGIAQKAYRLPLGILAGGVGCLAAYMGLGFSPMISIIGGSTHGKTTAAQAAASAWGSPAVGQGLLHSLRQTQNSIELLAVLGNGTFTGLDDPASAEERVLKEIESTIFSLHSGAGKDRMDFANNRLREQAKWTTCVVITSEIALTEIIRARGMTPKAGTTARLPEVNVTTEPKLSDADYTRATGFLQHYGHVGPVLAAQLLEHETPRELQPRLDLSVVR